MRAPAARITWPVTVCIGFHGSEVDAVIEIEAGEVIGVEVMPSTGHVGERLHSRRSADLSDQGAERHAKLV